MVLLGIDPGLRFSGFGVFKKEKGKTSLLDYGYLKMSSSKSLIERVGVFHDFFDEKIKKWQVTELALETPFLGRNAQNFLKLGYLRGLLYLLAGRYNLQVHEFSPREVKLSVTGFGGATKEQVSRVILKILPGVKNVERDDVTDALAVCLCGVWKSRLARLI